MRAGKRDAFHVGIRIDLGGQQVVAWHQVAGGRRFRTEREILALQVGQLIDVFAGGDEHGAEFRVFLALHQRHDLAAAAHIGLHESKTAEPDHVELVIDQAFHGGRVIGDGRKFHLHAQLFLQIAAQRLELALQFRRRFVGNGGHAQHLLRLRQAAVDGQRGGNGGQDGGEFGEFGHGTAFRKIVH